MKGLLPQGQGRRDVPCTMVSAGDQTLGTSAHSNSPVGDFRKSVLLVPKAIFLILKAVVYLSMLALELGVTPAPRQPSAEPEAPFCNGQESHRCPRAYGPIGHGKWKKPCYPHFTNGNRVIEKPSDLPKAAQEVCGQPQSHEDQSSALTMHRLLSFMW